MLRAAYRNGDERMSVAELAEREGIPYAFARSIQHDLTKCGFVNTTRGAGAAPCGRSATCAYNKVWRGADRILSDYLGSITLKDLFELGGDHPSVREALGDSDDGCSACMGTFGLALEGGCHGKASR